MEEKIRGITLDVVIDDREFSLDYSFDNVSKIWEMMADKSVSPFILPHLAMCMLAHTAYFKDYPLDDVIDLLYKYWVDDEKGMILKGFNTVSGFTMYQFEHKIKRGGE
ncbi:hypothetical protein ML603_03330 [Streptococcus dysgalactiae subsp. equisimilis]|uniref:hypothetical protein n=1 Tax=Streptococcus dysgalactiae TaxID=1334 RepID=UPI001F143BAD|nr:hypothetical protein [Streptococcus dysgalactiae]MCL6222535.1 hypothetical protein [Streptococcus dysgalactiae subsp. equisimilis]UMY68743.1 hypothetical protein ML603_03330 [Streptococcus dysgalactiae subsp. equisimilis]